MTWLRKDHYNTRINLAALLAPDTAWFLHLQEDWINSSSQQHHCHNKLVLLRGVTGRITSCTTEAYKMVHHNGIARQYFSPAVTHHKCSHAPCVLENTVESLPSASPAIAPLGLGCIRHSLEKQLCILPSASSLPRDAICYLSSWVQILTLMEESLGFRCFNSPHTHTRSFFSAYFLRGCPFFGTFPTYREGHLTHAKWNTLSFQRERFSFPLFTQFRLHEFSCFLLKHKYFLPFKLLLDKLGINSVIYKYLGHSHKVACLSFKLQK